MKMQGSAPRKQPGKNAESLPSAQAGQDSWRYCTVCRRHHDQGRKHIFTKKHQSKLSTLLSKFSQKVRSARQQLQKPGVMDGELEPDSTLWCYCCQQEVTRHVTDRFTTLVWGGLLEHMASPPHHKKTRRFWWLNGADKKQLQNFILFEAEYSRYKELAASALNELETKREIKRNEEARLTEAKKAAHELVAMEPPLTPRAPQVRYVTVRNKFGVQQNPTGRHEGRRVWGGGIVKYRAGSDQLLAWPIDKLLRGDIGAGGSSDDEGGGPLGSGGKVTVAATSGSQLTAIEPPRLREGEGNVHSGATPPWLLADDGEEEERGKLGSVSETHSKLIKIGKSTDTSKGKRPQTVIGPSEEEFLRHREQMRRRGRKGVVGGDFHLKLGSSSPSPATSIEWFPSFGRVWNAGPRSHSLAEFKRESSATHTGISEPSSLIPSSSAASFDLAVAHPEIPGPSGLNPTGARVREPSLLSPNTTGLPVHPPLPVVSEVRPYVRKRKPKSAALNQDNGGRLSLLQT